MQPVTDLLFFSSRVLALYRCTRNKEYIRLMCIKEVRNGELMLPHHVNSWTIPVDLDIVSRENAKIPKTGTRGKNQQIINQSKSTIFNISKKTIILTKTLINQTSIN